MDISRCCRFERLELLFKYIGLPIFPGLLRYEEAATGNITHAIRFTVPKAQKAYTYPGNHYGPHSNVNYPIYGMRFRLKVCML